MVKGKEKFALWITPECKKLIDACYTGDQCQSRGEYIEKAIWFYSGFLYAEKADRYLPKALQQILAGTLDRFAERIGRQLFKLAVEQNVNNHILASDTDIDARSYQKMRGLSMEEVKRTNGKIDFEDVLMSKLIQKAGFLNTKRAGRYMNYIATRDGVELLDENADSIYMRYIATRPRAERHGEHGLFGAEDAVDLEKTMDELKAHEGNVWTIIYSLRREDAARLGYDNAESWHLTLLAHQNDFAEAMQIPLEHLRWYAAFHDEGEHPHIHMMLWSDDPQNGFLRKDRLLHMQSVLTNTIYADELKEIYIQKDVAYKEVTEAAREIMRELVDRIGTIENPPKSIQQKLLELALELRTVGGKKQYGYLKKPLKDMVDSIVDELEKLPEVAAYYSVWNGLRDTLEGYYKNRPRQHNPLSQQKEFRAIKNAIIQEAERLRQQMEKAQTAAEQESSQDEEPSAEKTSTDASTNPTLASENTSSGTSHSARLSSEYLLNSTVRLFHQMGQIFRDNAAPPSNPMGIRVDSKRRKKLMQKRLAMGHKQDDHEQEQGYNLDIR